jgi:drug/metabolite transporter (DMT)-like permease
MNAFTATIYGLLSALSWGAGDFSGGMATKRSNAFTVVLISQFVGGILLVILALFFGETLPQRRDLLFGAMAGLSGMVGLLALYHGLASRQMGLFAPLSAVIAALFPLPISFLTEGLPSPLTLVGFVVALLSVWLLSMPDGDQKIQLSSLGLPLLAGSGFGFFFIAIAQVSDGAVLFPLVSARVASAVVLLLVLWGSKQTIKFNVRHLPVIALAGIFDVGGNAFFALAAQTGRLDEATLLSSLFPATTVFLAWVILKEQLNRWQWVGVVLAIVALVLIAAP